MIWAVLESDVDFVAQGEELTAETRRRGMR